MVNCCVPGCKVARTPKWQGVSIFKFPKRQNEFYTKWRNELVNVIDRNRELTPSFKKAVIECSADLHICENHFDEKDWYYTPGNKKFLNDNALPNPYKLPAKSFTREEKERKPPTTRVVVLPSTECGEEETSTEPLSKYNNLNELFNDLNKKKWFLNDKWCSDFSCAGELRLFIRREPQLVPYIEVLVDSSFQYSVFVYGWLLPKTHSVLKTVLQNEPIKDFMKKLTSLNLCPGLDSSYPVVRSKMITHVVPSRVDYKNNPRVPFATDVYHRSLQCHILCDNTSICSSCEKVLNKAKIEMISASVKPLHPNTPLSAVKDSQRIFTEIKAVRKENIELKKKLQREIESRSVNIDTTLASDLDVIMNQHQEKVSPFMKLFWEEQKSLSAVKSNKGCRYHPMIIRFCLSLHF